MCRDAFKGYVKSIVERNNSITGVRYCDDPTIMAWDLVNEPFNPGDDTGKILTVRSIDTRHFTLQHDHVINSKIPARVIVATHSVAVYRFACHAPDQVLLLYGLLE